jgi:hypothetical protein
MTPLYIFDLDGTLALIEHRRPILDSGESDRWDRFYAACVDDAPNWPVIDTMHGLLRAGADVRIWSGRSAVVMNETLAWLQKHVFADGLDPDQVELCMRRTDDFTPDEQLKRAWLDSLSSFDRRRLVAVFDDRDKVVAMWRAAGVACFQVAPGAF